MPAGNILSNDIRDIEGFLEGLARLDFQGSGFVNVFNKLIDDIQSKYQPDIILIDSRTGFNNLFGTLAKLSKHIIILAGDDIQNQPGTEYVSKLLSDSEINATFVLSILSSNFRNRFNNFNNYIQNVYNFDADTFYFDRQNVLEYIGTSLSDEEDLNDFISGENGSMQYHKFFGYVESIVEQAAESKPKIEDIQEEEVILETKTTSENEDTFEVVQPPEINSFLETEVSIEIDKTQDIEVDPVNEVNLDNPCRTETNVQDFSSNKSLQDRILDNLSAHLPSLYAETTTYDTDYINNIFYFRPCMEDFLIPEKCILLGDKGTGKTAFYKALQNEHFFKRLVTKSQKQHLKHKVLNVTNYENDNFEILKFDDYLNDELFVKRFWVFFIWQAICTRGDYESKLSIPKIDLSRTSAQNKIIELISNSDLVDKIEDELYDINAKLNSSQHLLILTFDRLDNIVKPNLWNDIVSPLVKLSINCPWNMIFPKLFLRRDLYDRLGNLTNKHSFSARVIDLEWSQNEMFSYF